MFESRGDIVVVSLAQRDRDLIGQLPTVLAGVVEETDPGHAVLHRDAYPQDPTSSDEFAGLVEGEANAVRAQDQSVAELIASGAGQIDREQALSLLRVVNEARLVLAARAGAMDEGPGWEQRVDGDPALAAVAWLGYLQSELVDALMTA
jgi:hypothetical protein